MKATVCLLGALIVANCVVTQYTAWEGHVRPLISAVEDLASCNATLNDTIERARSHVRAVNEENTQLKASLDEGVKMLQEEIQENNDLNDEIERLTWRNTILQNILDKLGTDEDETFEP